MKSRITFNGMNRYSPPNSAQPGDCTAIVNLRNQTASNLSGHRNIYTLRKRKTIGSSMFISATTESII